MKNKTALYLVFSVTVSAQSNPAPMPRFPTGPEYYSTITIPSEASFAGHNNSIKSAKFGIWID